MLLEQTQRKQKKPNKPKGIGTKHSRNHWKTKKKTNKPKTFQRIRKCGMRFSRLPISDSLKKFFVFFWFFWFSNGFCFVVIPCLLVVLVFLVSSGLPTSQHCCSAHSTTHALKAIRHVCAGIPHQEGSAFFFVGFGLPDGFACFSMMAIFGWGEFHVFVILDFVKSVIVACVCVRVCA